MTEQQIFDLLGKIRRFENRNGEFFKGWESALDTVECDFKEYFAAKRKEIARKAAEARWRKVK